MGIKRRTYQAIFGVCAIAVMLAACGEDASSPSSSASISSASGSSDAASTSSSVSNSSIHEVPPGGLVALPPRIHVAPSSSAVVTISRFRLCGGFGHCRLYHWNGTATSGADYSPTSGTLTWEDGDSSGKTVTVPVTSQGSSKYFAFALTSVAGHASFGSPATAAVEISSSTASTSSSSSGGGSGSSSGSSSSGVSANTSTGTQGPIKSLRSYMASYTVLGPGETISTIQGELNDLDIAPRRSRVIACWCNGALSLTRYRAATTGDRRTPS